MYIVEAKSYNKTYGVIGIRKVFNGDKKTAYEKAMEYAYNKAKRFSRAGTEFSVTIRGKDWQTTTIVNPM